MTYQLFSFKKLFIYIFIVFLLLVAAQNKVLFSKIVSTINAGRQSSEIYTHSAEENFFINDFMDCLYNVKQINERFERLTQKKIIFQNNGGSYGAFLEFAHKSNKDLIKTKISLLKYKNSNNNNIKTTTYLAVLSLDTQIEIFKQSLVLYRSFAYQKNIADFMKENTRNKIKNLSILRKDAQDLLFVCAANLCRTMLNDLDLEKGQQLFPALTIGEKLDHIKEIDELYAFSILDKSVIENNWFFKAQERFNKQLSLLE